MGKSMAIFTGHRNSCLFLSGNVGRYPEKLFRELPEFDRPETAVLPLPRLYLQAKQLASDLQAEQDGEATNGDDLWTCDGGKSWVKFG